MKWCFFILLLLPLANLFGQEELKYKSVFKGLNKEIEERFFENQSEGVHNYEYFFDGKLIIDGFYFNGIKSGLWKYYRYDNSALLAEGNWENGKKQGNWKYFSGSNLICSVNYFDGVPDGMWQSYYDTGTVFSEVSYFKGKKNGISRQYYENGNLFNEINYTNNLKDSIAHFYYENGSILEEIPYKKGQIDGLYKIYHKNGELFYELLYKDGNKNTLVSVRDKRGNHLEAGDLKDGNGEITLYYLPDSANMQVYEHWCFFNGKPNGKYEQYSNDGKLLINGKYKNGFKIGKWEIYSASNQRLIKRKYKISEQKYDVDNAMNFRLLRQEKESSLTPIFQGGESRLYKFISENLIYPEDALLKNIKGRVIIGMIINETGEIEDVRLIMKQNSLLDEAALDVVKIIPPFFPVFQKGLPLKVFYQIPFNFQY